MSLRLGVLWALFVASMKMFVRNRAAVFFSLFLPLVIMLIFGVLNFEGSTEVEIGVADAADNDASALIVSGLEDAGPFVVTAGDREAELVELEEGDRDIVLVIPDDFSGEPGVEGTGLVAYVGQEDPQNAQVGVLLLQQVVAQSLAAPNGGAGAGAGAGGGPGPGGAPVAIESVSTRDLAYIDFLVPGIVGMTVMQLGLFGVAFGFVQLKRTGALRRLFATPTSPAYFLAAQVSSRLVIGFVQVAILIGVGLAFGLQMFGDYGSLAVIVLLGSVIFLAIGFAIAGWAKNEDQAAPVANLVSLPMMFLSGVFFPREAMPEVLAAITQFMPLTYVIEAMRAIVNEGATVFEVVPQLIGIGIWAALAFILAVVLFRWE